MEFRTMRATRLSVANYNTMLSSDSLETGTGSSNSLPSTIQPVGLCAYRRIGGGCEIGCLYRYDEYSEGILLCTTRIGERMGGFPVHYLLVDAKGKTARIIVRGRRGS